MKYKKKYDIDDRILRIFTEYFLEIIQVISKNTWIYEVPSFFVEFLNDNYDTSLESIKYIPNIYFQLNYIFQKNRTLIKKAIKSFKKYNKINEIDISFKPLKKGFIELMNTRLNHILEMLLRI